MALPTFHVSTKLKSRCQIVFTLNNKSSLSGIPFNASVYLDQTEGLLWMIQDLSPNLS